MADCPISSITFIVHFYKKSFLKNSKRFITSWAKKHVEYDVQVDYNAEKWEQLSMDEKKKHSVTLNVSVHSFAFHYFNQNSSSELQ